MSHHHLHSPTKLTEFARDFENEPESLLGRFVNKIQNVYNQGYNTVNEVSSSNAASKSNFYTEAASSSANSSESSTNPRPTSLRTTTNLNSLNPNENSRAGSEPVSIKSTESSNPEEDKNNEDPNNEGRTMLGVLKRLSNIMATKNSDLRDYKDTDLHRLWMPDSKAKECYDCSQKFSTFRRKHHCRLCGQIFCSKCCNQVVPGKIIMCSGDLKVCNYCSKIVLSYLKSPNIAKELHSDLQALQQDLTTKLEEETNKEDMPPLRATLQRKASLGYQEERFATYQGSSLSENDRINILQQSNSLITLHEEMQRTLPPQNCGTNLIEFLNLHHKAANKVQATAILGAMLAAGFLQPIVPDSEQNDFDENLHYRFSSLPKSSMDRLEYSSENINSEVSSPQFDANSSEPQPPRAIDVSLSLQSMQDDDENSLKWSKISSKFIESYCNHEEQLLIQMLKTYHLDLLWAKELTALCSRAANQFKPDYCTYDLWDIRNYINFKKVPGGRREKCTIVGGVVFSKNVAHKDMATRIENPRILLLQCPIVYERIEGKFVSISTVLLQEEEYLRNVCSRIMSFKPNIVLVHKNVAGIAQNMLKAEGITLVIDVKMSVMERLARTLQCDILTSIESNIAKPRLGYCNAFYIQNFSNDSGGSGKTLMFFEKLTSPRGYTCLLRGGSNTELAKVKKVAQFLVFARYNWRLEMSFLMEEFAQPLAPKPPIFDSKEPSPNENENIENEDLPQLRHNNMPKKSNQDRKSEDKILTAITENVTDNTDPLRSINILPNNIITNENSIVKLAVETRYDNRFRNALSSILLSVSPFLTFPLPYLETEQGRKCALRSLFPPELYYSKLWSNNCYMNSERHESLERKKKFPRNENERQLNPPHPFLTMKITSPIDNREVQTQLAEFRSFGGRFLKKKTMMRSVKPKESYQRPRKIKEDLVYKDALDIENHQRLPILFCSFYYNPKSVSSFCAPPTLLDMKFYGQHDIMLGQFLQRYCCVLTSICPLCKLPMLGHVRRYVHSMGCVQVFLSADTTKNDPNRIYFSAWCSICNEITPSVPISDVSQRLSFAKYLELRFHGHSYKRRNLDENLEDDGKGEIKSKCEHSLHKDYVHCFSFRGVGAKFQYTSIEVWEISLPPLIINLKVPKDFDHFKVLEEIKNNSMQGHEIYLRIHERIADLAMDIDEQSPLLSDLKATLSKDQFIFKQQVEIIQTLLTDKRATCYDLNDAMLMAKKVLAESIDLWGPRLHDIALTQKAAAKFASAIDTATICSEDSKSEKTDLSPTSSEVMPPSDPTSHNENVAEENPSSASISKPTPPPVEKKLSEQFLNMTDKKTIKNILTHLLPSTSPTNPLQSPFSSQEHYTLPLGAFPILVRDSDLSSIIAYSLTCPEYQIQIATLSNSSQNNNPNHQLLKPEGQTQPSNSSPNTKRKNHEGLQSDPDDVNPKSSPSNSSSSANEPDGKTKAHNNSPLEISFHDNGTLFTCKIYFAKEFDYMRAKSLKPPKDTTSLYKQLEKSKKREELKVSHSRTGQEIELVRKPSDVAVRPSNLLNQQKSQENKTEQQTLQEDIETCRNYLARSLCTSVLWEAQGGKSGSRFSKTSDDRFVLKEMNKTEMGIFENFAPNYFDYINKCEQKNHPTLLAKIFGVFKVTIKKKESSSISEKCLLVMENLFYDCDIKNKFDLKGSERNRLVNPTKTEGEEIVLLDENLVQMSWSKPLYILSHSKAVLKDAINRDSSFLEKNQVMDYSLLVGLDNKNSVLVVGIIDYIRTFTFDKKVESLVKQTGILGGNGKLPTVIPPERYKQRFTDAMDRYFYTVPDRWEGLSKI